MKITVNGKTSSVDVDDDHSPARFLRDQLGLTGTKYVIGDTGGSGSIYRAWRTLRPIAATAREMLILAAAARWSVDRGSLRTENGAVLHDASGRRAH